MTEDDVDPENPRPAGNYPRFRDNEWHYVPDDLAQTISLGPGGDGEAGQDSVPHKASTASCFCGLSSVSKRLY
ncbi:hypothetical protein [Halobacterium noricense]|uniref:hypothetical protein n=1 Tax=Halobacterium noricense TaxID=223182 RepID=UPI001E303CD6|nr:hypothetical protein [Halobacterium noricense]UHH27247.1 hypothetical protein LT974_16540 [Halobacterium noricense]UHH27248.1 hypothetical protein LT974_15735 [Halobacterium noricense]